MDLIADLPWPAWALPLPLVVAWALLWWRGNRRSRLRFAVLAPPAALAGVVLGIVVTAYEADAVQAQSGCPGPCHTDVAGFAASVDATSGLGGLLGANALLALCVAVPLVVVTVVVEYALPGRRRNREAAPPRQGTADH